MRTLDALTLLEFFGAEPIRSTPEDGFYSYRIEVGPDLSLGFSFNRSDAYVQVVLNSAGESLYDVSQEGATQMSIHKKAGQAWLVVDFEAGKGRSQLQMCLAAKPIVRWVTVIERED